MTDNLDSFVRNRSAQFQEKNMLKVLKFVSLNAFKGRKLSIFSETHNFSKFR